MEGASGRLARHMTCLGLAWLTVGCSTLEPEPASMSYDMYDSSTVAGSFSETEETEEEARQTNERTETDPATGDSSRASADDARRKTPEAAEARTASESAATPHPKAARYVTAMYELNDVSMPEETHRNIPELYRHCRRRNSVFRNRRPAAGDLAFFHNVVDANGDGRNNDWFTFVALVEDVHDSGTVDLLAYRDGEVRHLTMNLDHPSRERRDGGARLNSRLRKRSEDDPPFTRYLAGRLFSGYCSLLGDRSELLVVDNWQPGMDLDRGSP